MPHATTTKQPGEQFKVDLPVFIFKHNGMTTIKLKALCNLNPHQNRTS